MDYLIPVNNSDIVVSVVVPGNPVAAKRPRMTRKGWVYSPHVYEEYKELVASYIGLNRDKDSDSRFGVQALFYRSNRQRIDVDNLIKSTLDAATLAGIWKDDSQVQEIAARLYLASDEPRVEFIVYVLPDWSAKPTCSFCGREIKRWYPSYRKQFCSKKCKNESKRVTRTCEFCGQEFQVPQSTICKRHFCSKSCAGKFHRRKQTEMIPRAHCLFCGGPVSRKEYVRCKSCFWEQKRNLISRNDF